MTLELVNVGRIYGQEWIIRNMNLKVSNGEFLALLGPSGCGKSTSLRLIAGLENPDEGHILINNTNVTNISPVQRRIGMVFQSYALFPHLDVYENLALGLRIRGTQERTVRDKVGAMISLLQLDGYSSRKPSQLSGGQRQRVALARALLRDPLIYLLDEPMSNLDAQLKEDLRPEFRNIILNDNKPILYVTHDQHEAMSMADKIAVLNNGNIEQIGTPTELYTKPSSLFVAKFIGRPQMNFFKDGSDFIKGVRAEDLELRQQGIPCRLSYKEWLGSNQLLMLESSYGLIRLLAKPDISISENLFIGWETDKQHLFERISGKRISNIF